MASVIGTTSTSADESGGDVVKKASPNLSLYELPMIQKKIIQRSCKGPVSIKRVDPKGEYIVIENTCIKKPIVLTNWILKRRGVDVPANSFRFDKHFVLHPNRQVKIYAKDKGTNNPPHELVSDTVTNWGVGTYALTILCNHLNQEKASLLEKVEHYERDLQIKMTSSKDRKSAAASFAESLFGDDDVDLDGKGRDPNLKISRDFEFYYERNVRP